MTIFEQTWYNKYMNNYCTASTLIKLANAGKLDETIINEWIKERKERTNQKFIEELNEEDLELTEILDVAFCQYHLDKLEVYYINKFNCCDNGYNSHPGNHKSKDGIEEFNQILLKHNLEFIDGELRRIV